ARFSTGCRRHAALGPFSDRPQSRKKVSGGVAAGISPAIRARHLARRNKLLKSSGYLWIAEKPWFFSGHQNAAARMGAATLNTNRSEVSQEVMVDAEPFSSSPTPRRSATPFTAPNSALRGRDRATKVSLSNVRARYETLS